MNDPVTSKLLAEGIRRLEGLGVTARVRASASDEKYNVSNSLHRCIQLLRLPTEHDWRALFEWTRQEHSKLVPEIVYTRQSQEDELPTDQDEVHVDIVPQDQEIPDDHDARDLHIPTWSPDRLLTHTVRSALLSAGTTGLATRDLKRVVTGPFYIRPVDRFLDRCVWRWQRTQPLHLRHLAIIRDSAQVGKTSFYVHFVHDAFGIKVENQETFWEAVQSYPETNEIVVCDQYGFPAVPVTCFMGKKHDMTLKKALMETGVTRHNLTFGEVMAKLSSKGLKTLRERAQYALNGSNGFLSEHVPDVIHVTPVSIGRPRKYPTAGTVLDFSTMTSEEIRKALTSQQRAQEYLRKKAHKLVEELIIQDVPQNEAEKSILAELDLSVEAYEGNTILIPAKFKEVNGPASRKRKRGKPQYLPSILAHTIPLRTIIEPEEPPSKRQRRTQRQTRKQKQKSINLGYLPSVSAHTQPFLGPLLRVSSARHTNTDLISIVNPVASLSEMMTDILPSTGGYSNGNMASSITDNLSLTRFEYRRTSGIIVKRSHMPEEIVDKGSDSLALENRDSIENSATDAGRHLTSSTHSIDVQTKSVSEVAALEDARFSLALTGKSESQLITNDPAILIDGRSLVPIESPGEKSLTTEPSLKRKASNTTLAEHHTLKKRSALKNAEGLVKDKTSAIETNNVTINNGTTSTVSEVPSEVPAAITEPFSSTAQSTVTSPMKPIIKPQAPRMAPFGGTIAAMRKLIILGIVRNCGGAFPGDGELVYPFLTAYAKKFPDAKPDNKTIKLAKTMLIGEGKLKQVFFTCKSPSGVIQSKSIIAFPDIPDTDQRIGDLQKAMAKGHPHPYFPPGTDIRPDLVPKAAFYNASGLTTFRQGPYANELPIISDRVIPQYPWKSHGKSARRASNVSFETIDDAGTLEEHPSPSKSKKRKRKTAISKEDQIGDVVKQREATEPAIEAIQSTSTERRSDARKHNQAQSKQSEIGLSSPALEGSGEAIEHQAIEPVPKRGVRRKISASGPPVELPEAFGAAFEVGKTNIENTVATQPVDEQDPKEISSQKRVTFSDLPEQPKRKRQRKSRKVTAAEVQEDVSKTQLQAGEGGMTNSTAKSKSKGENTTAYAIESVDTIPSGNASSLESPISKSISPDPIHADQVVDASKKPRTSSRTSARKVSALNGVSTNEVTKQQITQAQSQSQSEKTTRRSSKTEPVPLPFQQVSQQLIPNLAPGSSLIAAHSLPLDQDSTPWELFSSMTENMVQWELSQPEAFHESSRDVFVHYPFLGNHLQYLPLEKKQGEERAAKNITARLYKKQDSGRQMPDLSAQPNSKTIKPFSQTPSMPKLSALEVLAQRGEKTPGVRYSKGKDTRPRQVDPRRARYQWDQNDDRKLLIGSLFGHIALGGVREENHWGIVSRMLDHKYERELCRRRWSAVRTKYRGDLELITSELRTALLDSYERGDAPELNFTTFWDNDWNGILTWAMDQIENPKVQDVELPTTREAFEATFVTQNFPHHECPDFLESKRVASGPLRQSVLNAGVRVVQDIPEDNPTKLDLAKTLIRANILTPQDSYKSAEAKAKLQQFPEAIIEEAINELLTDRVISQANRGRVLPNRTYDVSTFFLKAMQWKLSAPHFKYAVAFKEILDEKFKDNGKIEYKSAFGNGEMITLLNLLADDMIKIHGKNIPNKKFGLTTEGYKTRSMDKKVFNFDVFVEASKTYCYGIPTRPLPSPPLSAQGVTESEIEDHRIPLWVDIHGDLLPLMWDLAVAAVGTALVIDTAADSKHIAERIKPCVADFEVQLIMEWLVEAGVAEWKDNTHDTIELKTYWWSVITTPIAKGGSSEEAVMIAGVPLQ